MKISAGHTASDHSTDTQPRQMTNLVERLRSRFERGRMIDVQPSDLETTMAMVDKKAEQALRHMPVVWTARFVEQFKVQPAAPENERLANLPSPADRPCLRGQAPRHRPSLHSED